jgi:Do/DeqQ family serine protease
MFSRNIRIILLSGLTALLTIWLYDNWQGRQTVIIQEKPPSASWVKQQESYWPEPSYSLSLPEPLPHSNNQKGNNFVNAAQVAAPAVVYLRSRHEMGYDVWGESYTSSSGSGVIVSPEGYIVTNNHVIEEGDNVEVILNDRREYRAQIIGTDPTTDIALLKIDAKELPFLGFGDSDSLMVGEWVLAVGNPFRLQSTVTAGIVSAKARDIDILDSQYGIESFIQTDAAVNQGNSGGALVNIDGELVGINTAIITYSGRYEGYSFAIPANLVKKVISDLKEFGTVHRGLLGVEARTVDDKIAQDLGLSEVEGVYVFRVSPGSGSYEAGIQSGDVLVGINDQDINTLPQLLELVGRYRPGDTVKVQLLRDGRQKQVEVVLRNQLNTTDLVNVRKDELLTELGFEIRDLIRAEKESIGTEGVKVVSIYRGSAIERTKMDPGYIITHLNDQKVNSADEFVQLLKEAQGRVVLQGVYEQYEGPFWYVFEK